MTESTNSSRFSPQLIATSIAAVAFAAFVGLVKVPTTLGVKVQQPNSSTIEPDMTGKEYIWRVWWRARDDLIDFSPQWIVTAGLIALLAIFAAGMLLAIWLVTGPAKESDLTPTDG